MPPDALPPDVRRLLDERTRARDDRDWARADALRDELHGLGWQVEDGTGGSRARPILATFDDGAEVPLERPATVRVSLQVAAEDHPGDLARFLRGLTAASPTGAWELVVVANGATFDVDEVLGSAGLPLGPVLVRPEDRLGWADARTLGLRHSSGEVTVLLVTHSPSEAVRLGHRLWVLSGQPAQPQGPLTPRGLPPRDPADPAVLAMEAELLRELTRSAPLQEAS